MDNLDYTKICSEFYSNSEDGCCFECCEFLNHDECPVQYVKGLLEEKDKRIKELKELPKQIVEKIRKNFYRLCSFSQEDIYYTPSKFIDDLDNLLKDYKGDGE